LYGNIEYYQNNTKDILYSIQLPQISGFGSIPINIGEVKNHGLEIVLAGNIINQGDFKWNATVNFSRVRNEIVSILGADNDDDGKEDDLVANKLFIGEPQNVIYDWEITGENWQLSDKDAGIIPAGFYPGTKKIVDQNNDGAFSASDDRVILGYSDPSYRFGITNNIEYKNFKLYFFINSVQGGKDYYRALMEPESGFNNIEFITHGVGPKGAWDYWMPENPDAKYRRTDISAAYSGVYYEKRNFVRLQDVTLSYAFESRLLSKLQIKGLKVFVSGKNLITLTKWEGIDPELGTRIAPGALPVMRNYSAGVDIKF